MCTAILGVGGFTVLMLAVFPSFFWRDDFQLQYLPVSREIASAVAEGSWPLLAHSSWFGGALAGEYQHGVLSPVSVAVDSLVWSLGLGLGHTAAAISGLYLVLLWLGSYVLARSFGLSPGLARMVAVVSSFNGWMVDWGAGDWSPALRSFAWLPWFWWALRRAREDGELRSRSRWRCIRPGLFLALLLTAGWPTTVLMAGLLSVQIVLGDWWRLRSLRALWMPVGAWMIGLGLAAPALATLIEFRSFAARGAMGFGTAFSVPPAALGGLVLPTVTTRWNLWGTLFPYLSLELAGGWIPLAGLVVGLWLARQRLLVARRNELCLLLSLLVLMMAPSFGAFRFSFRWLPFFHLVLALVGAAGFAAAGKTSGRHRHAAPVAAGLLVLPTAVVYGLSGHLGDAGPRLALGYLALAAGWWLMRRWGPFPQLRDSWPAVVVVVSLLATYLVVPVGRVVPQLQVGEGARRIEPLEPEVRYLSVYRFADLGPPPPPTLAYQNLPYPDVSGLRPANVPMLSGMHGVSGYSPLGPSGMARRLHLRVHGEVVESFLDHWPERVAPDGLLQLMAIDGLLVAEGLWADATTGQVLSAALEQGGWRTAGRMGTALVFRRLGSASPRVRSLERLMRRPGGEDWVVGNSRVPVPEGFEVQHLAVARTRDLRETRLAASVEVEVPPGTEPGLVLFSRPWYPGYRARLEPDTGGSIGLTVQTVEGILPAVSLPPGARGRLVLEYRSPGLRYGMVVALSVAATLLVLTLMEMWRRRQPARVDLTPTSAGPRRDP